MNVYDKINDLNDMSADLDDIHQKLINLSLDEGDNRVFDSLVLVQKEIDDMIDKIQSRIDQMGVEEYEIT